MAGSGVKVARVYLRVSTDDQDLTRQENIVAGAKAAGFYVAAVYREWVLPLTKEVQVRYLLARPGCD